MMAYDLYPWSPYDIHQIKEKEKKRGFGGLKFLGLHCSSNVILLCIHG